MVDNIPLIVAIPLATVAWGIYFAQVIRAFAKDEERG